MQLYLLLSGLALALTLLNALTIKVVKNNSATITKTVSILIPMRNEEQNVIECINSVSAQEGLKNFEIIVLDDHSEDQTADLLSKFMNISKLNGTNLPDDWLGKLWACQQLADASTGEYLVYIDADVRLSRNAVASAISKMGKWDFISPYPKQIAIGFVQRLFQPLLQWSWLASVPLFISQKLGIKSMAVANGQFLIIKRDAYFKSGGHQSVKSEVIDDIMLARQLLASGYSGGVAEASQVASCHMYKTAGELVNGYRKSLWKAFGSIFGTSVAILILFISGVAPFIGAIFGSKIGLISFGLIVLSRFISSIRTGTIPNTALLHPLAIVFLIGLIIYSWIGKLTNTLTWRDRKLS
jgi:glycosyltransferase involved in cell wall biosynthesis